MKLNTHEKRTKIERPGREIKIDNFIIKNKNVTVRIGTTDNKNCPQTVYLIITFWVDIKNKSLKSNIINFDSFISKKYEKHIKSIKINSLKDILTNNKYFPYYYDNIFTFDFPDNINYNNKKSFTTIELTLHTLNCNAGNKINNPYPLKNNSTSEIYNELINVAKTICQTDLLHNKLEFKISKTKK